MILVHIKEYKKNILNATKVIQVAKILGTGLATTGLIGAGVGIGVVFGALILGVLWSRVSQICLIKLSNSGDTLKLLVLSLIWKYKSGWTNYSDTVTSQKMIEKEMGYRGSKSIVCENTVVKEQRLDGSCIGYLCNTLNNRFPMLRYGLTGFERNYQIKALSNQINSFHTTRVVRNSEGVLHAPQQNIKQNFAINLWYFTGFVDAEGCFLINIRNNNKLKIGWNVELRFQICLHEKDTALLEQIKNCLGVGTIYKDVRRQAVKFLVLSIKDIAVIIDHFDKYPLITQKRADYELFKQAFIIISNKEHVTKEGLLKIVALKSSLNLGLPENLKIAFAEDNGNIPITPIDRPLVVDQTIKDPFWLVGFTDGDGSFGVLIRKSSLYKIDRKSVV